MSSAPPETAELLHAGGEHVRDLMAAIEARLRDEATGHGPVLAAHAGATIAAGGKRLRPLLVLLAAGEPGTPDARDALICAGVAVELVHSATLVHDDVLDGATVRRGEPTVVATGGRDRAVATGDLLFARAFTALAQAPGDAAGAVRVLSDACSALALGELAQREDAWSADVSVERYLHRCDLKTARLFEAACRLGTRATQEPADLGDFGRRIGIAFQLLDDVLDVAGPETRTGKARGTDLLDGTITLPFIVARERDPALAALDPRAIGAGDTEQICDAITATGALDETRARALSLIEDAKRDLPEALDDQRRAALQLVADSVVQRYA